MFRQLQTHFMLNQTAIFANPKGLLELLWTNQGVDYLHLFTHELIGDHLIELTLLAPFHDF